MIAMATVLKKGVVAEGVEAEAQMNFLRTQSCDDAQGYYYCKAWWPLTSRSWLRQAQHHVSSMIRGRHNATNRP
jgi:sensor c-di-GMP phosphodiesterase-like protein